MFPENTCNKANRFGWWRGAAAIGAMAILTGPFCGSAQAADMSKPASPKGEAKSMSSMDMHKSIEGMKEKMASMQMTGNTDYDFATMMRMHHQGALDMAEAELMHGKDPTMRSMAKGIVAAQKKEIKQFDQWLEKHKQPMPQGMPKSK